MFQRIRIQVLMRYGSLSAEHSPGRLRITACLPHFFFTRRIVIEEDLACRAAKYGATSPPRMKSVGTDKEIEISDAIALEPHAQARFRLLDAIHTVAENHFDVVFNRAKDGRREISSR